MTKKPEKKPVVRLHKQIEKQPEKKIKLEIEADEDFDIEKVHAQHIKRQKERENEKKRDVRKHLQKEYDIDAKASYERSVTDESSNVVIAHVQSVLGVPGKYDK